MRKRNHAQWKGILITLTGVFLMNFALLNVFGQNSQPFDPNRSPLPAPTGPIMDYAGVIDNETEKRIEAKLIGFRDSSNPKVEIAVAVVDTTDGTPIFDYSLAVARGWKIGTTNADNPGALLLVAVKDRKYFTQIGYDLEDELSDGTVGTLQRRFLVPEFKKANYGKGIEDTIDAYIATIEAKQKGEPDPIGGETEGAPVSTGIDREDMTCCVVIVLAFLLFVFMTIYRASQNVRKGGGRPRGRDYASAAGEAAIDIAGGLILGALSGGGSGGSSSDSGSSGGDWGGFGGGGDFGGGGSGGDW